MNNKRGYEYRTELRQLKKKFISDISKLKSTISKVLENAPENDFFNNIMLEIGYKEVSATIKAINSLEKSDIELYLINDLLSNRELDIYYLTIKGYTTKEMAENLSIVEKTVRFHLKNILAKIANDRLLADIIKNNSNLTEFVKCYDVLGKPILQSPEKFLKKFYEYIKN